MTALRFFFKVTLRRSNVMEDIAFTREPRRLPIVLGQDEAARLLAAAPGVKYKAASSIAYGTGLRASEVISLKSERWMSRSATRSALPPTERHHSWRGLLVHARRVRAVGSGARPRGGQDWRPEAVPGE